ncbi:MAG: hypothetical protein HQK61_08280 [Desulfamplus sp.]|nr:hypothetical protein [Desulfamplus sp.]
MEEKIRYTCNEYREEMILAALRQRLANEQLTLDERQTLIKEIEKIENEMGF